MIAQNTSILLILDSQMTAFGVTLEKLLQERGITQAELARKSVVSPTQISRYVAGEASPEPEPLELICAAMDDDAGELLTAYLRDRIPAKLRDRVVVMQIRTAGQLLEEAPSPTPALDRAPIKTRQLLDAAAAECERRPELSSTLESIVTMLSKQ